MLQSTSIIGISPGRLQGNVHAPPSKSVMQRVLAAVLLRNASLLIRNPGNSADDQVLKDILVDAGFQLGESPDHTLLITAPKVQKPLRQVYFGESGLAARMMIPILALKDTEIALDAAPGLRSRPMAFLNDVLPALDVIVSGQPTNLPATMQGPLYPRDIVIDGSLSSQFLSGLLFAYSAAHAREVSIRVNMLASRPYIDLTLQVMEDLGFEIPLNYDYQQFSFSGKCPVNKFPAEYQVEGDWSAAAFWLVAGAISGAITVTGLDAFSLQPDKQILQALMDAGAALSIESGRITAGPAVLTAFQFNATDCPDLFPPLAVLACFSKGTSVIEGVGRLRHKESDRAKTIISELGRMGAKISIQDDLMLIQGSMPLKGVPVEAHNDHRIAMMCAIAASGATGKTILRGADSVNKSYPGFFNDLQALGATVSFAQ